MSSVESVVVWSSMSRVTVVPTCAAAAQISGRSPASFAIVEGLAERGELQAHLGVAGQAAAASAASSSR